LDALGVVSSEDKWDHLREDRKPLNGIYVKQDLTAIHIAAARENAIISRLYEEKGGLIAAATPSKKPKKGKGGHPPRRR